VTVLRSKAVPAVRLDIVVPAGMGEQDRLLQALFTNRMLREGTATLAAPVIAEHLDHLGAWLELSVSVHHSFVTLYTLRRHFADTFRLVADLLLNPTFPDERLAVVRQNNRSQFLVSRQRGDAVARRLFAQAVYGPGHPCASFAEAEDYDTLVRDDLLRFHAAHYHPSAFTYFLSGDVDTEVETLVANFKSSCGDAPLTPAWRAMPPPAPSPGGILLHTLPTAVQASIRIGGLMMDVGSDDYHLMRILTTVLGGYFGSRLMRSVREEQGLTYGIQADLYTNTRQVLFAVSSEATADKGRAVVDEVVRQCERLCTEPVPDDELTRVRSYMTGEIYRNYESVYNLVDAHIYTHTLGLTPDHIARALSAIRTATPADLLAAARRWLKADQFHTVIVSSR